MDTASHLYRYVYGMVPDINQELRLVCVDFANLSSGDKWEHLRRPLWGINEHQCTTLTSLVSFFHAKRWSWRMTLPTTVHFEESFLLTNDPEIRWVYSGPVKLSSSDPELPQADHFEIPFPLVTRSWIGVVLETPSGLMLEAFSHADIDLKEPYQAYSPEWNDGFDDEDLTLFQVSFPSS